MQNIKEANQPFDLKGTFNTRELGGYVNEAESQLKKKQLLRSDILSNLTDEDMEKLYDYGVRTVIDLRRDNEVLEEPCKLENYNDINYFNVSLSTNDGGLMQERKIESLAELYQTYLTERQTQIKEIIELISDNLSRGTVMFNCTAGKDRTGIISMFLLKICGVDDETITIDYEVSEKNIANYLHDRKKLADIPDFLLRSPREDMEKTLQFIKENYGTAQDYLEKIQVDARKIEAIRNHVIGEME